MLHRALKITVRLKNITLRQFTQLITTTVITTVTLFTCFCCGTCCQPMRRQLSINVGRQSLHMLKVVRQKSLTTLCPTTDFCRTILSAVKNRPLSTDFSRSCDIGLHTRNAAENRPSACRGRVVTETVRVDQRRPVPPAVASLVLVPIFPAARRSVSHNIVT